MAEVIDIFDGNQRPVGRSDRVTAHRQGLWHQTFHCWIVGEREGRPFVLLQLRSSAKRDHPDRLDITAAGHLAAGESRLDGVREIEEELGIAIAPGNLVSLGVKHDVMDGTEGDRTREFAHVHLLRDDRELTEYRLCPDEVAGLVEVPLRDGLDLFTGAISAVDCPAIRAEKNEPRTLLHRVTRAAMVPRVDRYYLKIFVLADLYLKGYPYLTV
jgi:isopentenyldiphosphate isomerase